MDVAPITDIVLSVKLLTPKDVYVRFAKVVAKGDHTSN